MNISSSSLASVRYRLHAKAHLFGTSSCVYEAWWIWWKDSEKKNRQRQKHMYRVFLYTRGWYIGSEVCGTFACMYVCECVCPGTCEVVCGRRGGKLIKPMITLMRSQGVKLEKAFHFLSHSIPLSLTSIHPSLLYTLVHASVLFFTRDIKA